LGSREKLQGRAGFCQEIFFLKSGSCFKFDFSRAGVTDFFSGDPEVKNAVNSNPRKAGFKIIFKFREGSL
jgi:hypothetical protein